MASSPFTAGASSARPATRCWPNSRAPSRPCEARLKSRRRSRPATIRFPDTSKMQFRVGVNLGDVVVKGDDLLGDGVNVAARLETIAEPGGICISSSVYDQITGKLDLGFQDIGEQTLKNISRSDPRIPRVGYRRARRDRRRHSDRRRPSEDRCHGGSARRSRRQSSYWWRWRGRPDGCDSARPTVEVRRRSPCPRWGHRRARRRQAVQRLQRTPPHSVHKAKQTHSACARRPRR